MGGVLRPRAERGVPVAVGGAAGGGGDDVDGGGGVRAVRGVRGVPVLLDVQHEQLRGHELLAAATPSTATSRGSPSAPALSRPKPADAAAPATAPSPPDDPCFPDDFPIHH